MMAKRMWTKMMRMKKVMKMAEDAEVDAEAKIMRMKMAKDTEVEAEAKMMRMKMTDGDAEVDAEAEAKEAADVSG